MRPLRLGQLQPLNPFECLPWDVYDLGSANHRLGLKALVEQSLLAERLDPSSFSVLLQESQLEEVPVSIRYHGERIAHLMTHGWSDPIELRCTAEAVRIEDGFHRFAAALLLGREHIFANAWGAEADIRAQLGKEFHESEEFNADDFVQHSDDGKTVWVHAFDGSTVGRFDTRFGMDVHNTVSAQMQGKPECLHCTHTAPVEGDWETFCQLVWKHHGVCVSRHEKDAEEVDDTQPLGDSFKA